MRVLVLRAPGTNCDRETAHAFELAGATAERVHVNRFIENPALGGRYQVLCLPGGFSYGDDIAAGKILAVRLQNHLRDLVDEFVHRKDRLVLGICNGMQVLMRLGVLTGEPPAADSEAKSTTGDHAPAATLTWNNHGRFEDRWVSVARDPATPCVFLRGIDRLELPIAHAEGKFVAADDAIRERLAAAGRLALRYVDPGGQASGSRLDGPQSNSSDTANSRDESLDAAIEFPHNPNGAEANVAGVCDASGRVFGLMPHPERHLDPTHHPQWTRRETQPEHGDGLAIFKNAVEYFS